MLSKQKSANRTIWDRGKAEASSGAGAWCIDSAPGLSETVKRELRGTRIAKAALGMEEDVPGLEKTDENA